MNTLAYFIRSLSLEVLKAKGTLVLWLALLAPLFVVGVAFTASYQEGDKFYPKGINPWIMFTGHILVGWSLFVFPFYVSFQSALVNALEHQASTWKYVYSLPLPKWSVYLSKLTLLTALIVLSHLYLFGFSELLGWFLGVLKPEYGFQAFTIHGLLAEACFKVLLSGLGMTAIQFFISLRFTHFVVPAGFGLLITLAGVISRSLAISHLSPYLWPISFLNNANEQAGWQDGYLYGSVVTYVLITIVGILITSRRDVQ